MPKLNTGTLKLDDCTRINRQRCIQSRPHVTRSLNTQRTSQRTRSIIQIRRHRRITYVRNQSVRSNTIQRTAIDPPSNITSLNSRQRSQSQRATCRQRSCRWQRRTRLRCIRNQTLTPHRIHHHDAIVKCSNRQRSSSYRRYNNAADHRTISQQRCLCIRNIRQNGPTVSVTCGCPIQFRNQSVSTTDRIRSIQTTTDIFTTNPRQSDQSNRCLPRYQRQSLCGFRWRRLIAILVNKRQLVLIISRRHRTTERRCQRYQIRCHYGRVQDATTRIALNQNVLGNHVDYIRVIKPTRNRKLLELSTRRRRYLHKQTIDRIVDQNVVVNLRTNSIVIRCKRTLTLVLVIAKERLLKTIRRRTHRRISRVRNAIERYRRTHVCDLYRINRLLNRVDHHRTRSTITNVRLIYVLTEDSLVLQIKPTHSLIQVPFEDQATPIPRRRNSRRCVVVQPKRLIEPRSKEHTSRRNLAIPSTNRVPAAIQQTRCSQDLQCTARTVHTQRRTSYPNTRAAHLEDRTRINHHRHTLRYVHRGTIRKHRSG